MGQRYEIIRCQANSLGKAGREEALSLQRAAIGSFMRWGQSQKARGIRTNYALCRKHRSIVHNKVSRGE